MATSDLSVCTINVRGLRSKTKRRALFKFLRNQKYDVMCLQETHLTDKDSDQWKSEWGGELFYSKETARSGGQIVLFRKGIAEDVSYAHTSPRILGLNVTIDEKFFFVCSIYAPNVNSEKINFLKELNLIIKSNALEHTLICGDFNTVLDNNWDIISGERYDSRIINEFNNLLNECDLYDVWRLFNPEIKEFTWSRNTPFIARRLDYILASSTAFDRILSSHIFSVPMSDHRACVIQFKFSDISKGPGYYKFNNSLLNDKNFAQKMNDLIDNFDTEDNDPQLAWELLKVKIREFSISYSKSKSIERRNKLAIMRGKLDDLDTLLGQLPNSDVILQQRNKIKAELEIAENTSAKAAQVRSRAKWIAEGEKNTKYFLGLEKAKAMNKIMDSVINKEGVEVNGQENILRVQKEYFESLYKKRVDDSNLMDNIKTFISDAPIPQLNVVEKELCDEDISVYELRLALKEMNNGSSPGNDGLTVAFYTFFWCQI